MAKVNEASMRDWNEGDTMKSGDYEKERSLLIAAINDTDDKASVVKTTQIASQAVTSDKIANGAIKSQHIDSQSLGNESQNSLRIDALLAEMTPINLSIPVGTTILNADRASTVSLKGLKGRTYVNQVGRLGNCESLSGFEFGAGHTTVLEPNDKVIGNNSIKVTATGAGSANGFVKIPSLIQLKNSQYCIAVMNLKSVSGATGIHCELWGSVGTKQDVTITTSWSTYVFKLKTSDSFKDFFLWANGAGTFLVDAIRLYEVTQLEMDATDAMTSDQLTAKYPYVDDMKSIFNPYLIAPGKNLLPPFTEWTIHSVGTVTEPYKLTHNITAAWQESTVEIDVAPSTQYSVSAVTSDANSKIHIKDASNGYVVITDTATSATFTTSATTKRILVVSSSANTSGVVTFTNPMLNVGSTALTFEPQRKTYQFLQTTLRSNVDGTQQDELYVDENGQLAVLRKQGYKVLDGSLPWVFSSDKAGYKDVYVPLTGGVNLKGNLVKYDGKILKMISEVAVESGSDEWKINTLDNRIYMYIADTDSGWGESYTPTADEIKAYFNGWKLYDGVTITDGSTYSSGQKWWAYKNKSGAWTGATQVLPTNIPSDWIGAPYQLQYQLATPVSEAVQSEGELIVHKGANQITMSAGVIVREAANIQPYNGGTEWHFNADGTSGTPNTRLTYPLDAELSVYENGLEFEKYNFASNAAFGKKRFYIMNADYKPATAYSVTYFAMDMYALGFAPQTLDVTYEGNLNAVVNQHSKELSGLKTQQDVILNTFARKQQPGWIAPTLLNGWLNYDTSIYYGAGFRKLEDGFVELRGAYKSGTLNTVAFYLPVKYRPSKTTYRPLHSENPSGTTVFGTCVIKADGSVNLHSSGNLFINIDGLRFHAEQ